MEKHPNPPFPKQDQTAPGIESKLEPKAEQVKEPYEGSGKLEGKRAVITSGGSGIGRGVAIAFAREDADVLISYLDTIEDEDANLTAEFLRKAGQKAVLVKGDIQHEAHFQHIIDTAVKELGGIDILVNNAAFQMAREQISDIPLKNGKKPSALTSPQCSLYAKLQSHI